MTDAERDPHVLVHARIGANQKMLQLPSHRARWGWVVMLGMAKLQHPAGRFASRRQAQFLAGEFRDCLKHWIDAGLLHSLPVARECPKCSKVIPADVKPDEYLVHDWKAHQERKSRVQEWRDDNGLTSGHGNKRGNTGETVGETSSGFPLTGARVRGPADAAVAPAFAVGGETDGISRSRNNEPVASVAERVVANLAAIDPIEDDEARVFAFLARCGAAIRPDAPLGRRLLMLIERRGAEAVLQEAARLARSGPLSDRQFVLGIENRLEALPKADDARAEVAAEADRKRKVRMTAEQHARRLDHYRFTGKWDPAWGPVPEWNPTWGQRPAA